MSSLVKFDFKGAADFAMDRDLDEYLSATKDEEPEDEDGEEDEDEGEW